MKVILGLVIGALITLAVMFFAEYMYFKNQAEKVVVLQTEYKNYVLALRRLLRGSQFLHNQVKSGDEKKNDEESGTLIMVNRANEFLKESSIAFFKRHHLDHIERQIDPNEWKDYTQIALNQSEPLVKSSHKNKKHKRVKRKSFLRVRMAHRAGRTLRRIEFPKKSNSLFMWPIDPKRFWVSSLFGPRKNPSGWGFHHGLDMASIRGTPVKAAASGCVVQIRNDFHGYGKMILIEHGNNYQTRYAHLDKIFVQQGQQVQRGSIIGRVGATGNVRSMGFDGSHLHFEIRSCGRTINPIYLLG